MTEPLDKGKGPDEMSDERPPTIGSDNHAVIRYLEAENAALRAQNARYEETLRDIKETKDFWNGSTPRARWATEEADAAVRGCIHDIAVLLERARDRVKELEK